MQNYFIRLINKTTTTFNKTTTTFNNFISMCLDGGASIDTGFTEIAADNNTLLSALGKIVTNNTLLSALD